MRGGIGLAGSFYLDPAHYLDPAWRNSLFALNVVNVRTNLLGATDLLSLAALDKYSFVRDGYLQRRRYLLGQGGRATCRRMTTRMRSTPSDVPKRIKPDAPASPDASAKPDADSAKPEATPPVPAATPAPARAWPSKRVRREEDGPAAGGQAIYPALSAAPIAVTASRNASVALD